MSVRSHHADEGGVSLIATVRNDRAGLAALLPALAAQTELPDEIVIVDGGSEDGSLELVESWKPGGTSVRVLVAPEANISRGRNIAVRAARHDWIVCTDAGCVPVPGWLAALKGARERADIAAGVFVVDGRSPLERAVACTYHPMAAEVHERSPLVRLSHRLFGRSFRASHASARSLGFSRRVWEAVGGFPEHVYASEDPAFSSAASSYGYRAVLVADAVVAWRPRATWLENAREFRTYARGDVRTPGRKRHVVRLGAYVGGLLALVKGGVGIRLLAGAGMSAYMWLPLRRAHRTGLALRDWWRIPLLIAMKDLAALVGAAQGIGDALLGVPQPNPRSRLAGQR